MYYEGPDTEAEGATRADCASTCLLNRKLGRYSSAGKRYSGQRLKMQTIWQRNVQILGSGNREECHVSSVAD